MDQKHFCQSCAMPLVMPEDHGTEADGSLSPDYCRFCYKEGSFTVPAMTLADMQSHITSVLDKERVPADIVETAVARLPFLERWKTKNSKYK